MIHLDTDFLVRDLLPGTPEQAAWDRWVTREVPVLVSAQVWAEFMCGPVSPEHVVTARLTLGSPVGIASVDAELAADLFNLDGRRRGSDCLIAAVAIRYGAELATVNTADFARFGPRGLRVARP